MNRFLLYLSIGVFLGCTDGLGPARDVSGTWTAAPNVESSMTLDLMQQGATVSGTGTSFSNIYPPTSTWTIGGSYSRPRLTLTFYRGDSVIESFIGTVLDADHMISVRTFNGGADTLTFVRR